MRWERVLVRSLLHLLSSPRAIGPHPFACYLHVMLPLVALMHFKPYTMQGLTSSQEPIARPNFPTLHLQDHHFALAPPASFDIWLRPAFRASHQPSSWNARCFRPLLVYLISILYTLLCAALVRVFVDLAFYLAIVYVMTARLKCPRARSLVDLAFPSRTFHLYDHFFPSPQASGLFGLIFPWLISRSRRNRNHDAPVDKNPPFWGELILWTDLKPAIIKAIDRRSVPNFFLTPQFEVT